MILEDSPPTPGSSGADRARQGASAGARFGNWYSTANAARTRRAWDRCQASEPVRRNSRATTVLADGSDGHPPQTGGGAQSGAPPRSPTKTASGTPVPRPTGWSWRSRSTTPWCRGPRVRSHPPQALLHCLVCFDEKQDLRSSQVKRIGSDIVRRFARYGSLTVHTPLVPHLRESGPLGSRPVGRTKRRDSRGEGRARAPP